MSYVVSAWDMSDLKPTVSMLGLVVQSTATHLHKTPQ